MNRRVLLIACFCSFLLGLAGIGVAQAPIQVAAVQIPLMVESSEKGVFIDLLQDISRRTGLKFDVKVYPGKRAHNLFKNKKADILIPFPKGNRAQVGLLSDPIYTKRDFVFVRKGSTIPRSLAELEGMTLGITSHYRYKPTLYEQEGIKLEPARDDVTNMKKLDTGRIDGFLIEEFTGQSAIEESQASGIVFDPRSPIFTYDAVILIQKGEKAETYQKAINSALSDMKSEGTYMKIISQIHKNM